MSQTAIPVIDLSKAETDRLQLARCIVEGLESIGFLYIENIPGIDFDMLYKSSKWFFDLPKETKMKLARNQWNTQNVNIYRGFFPVIEGETTYMEGFEFARDVPLDGDTIAAKNWFYENSVWPDEDGTVPFKTFLKHMYEIFHNTSLEILRLIAIGLNIDENAFESLFAEKPCSTFRLLHYPRRNSEPPEHAITEDGKVIIIPEHMDSEMITLLHVFNYNGLEILDPNGKWIPVPPRKNSLIMNIGVTFSKMTGNRFKATRHRVFDIGIDRFSVPFFLAPAFNCDISLNFMSKQMKVESQHTPEKFGPWLWHRMKHDQKYVEFKDLPELETD